MTAFAERFENRAMPMFERNFGSEVVLIAGAKASDPFTGIRSERVYEAFDTQTRLPVKVASHDWLIPKTAPLIDGQRVDPRAGMKIRSGEDEYEIGPVAKRPAVELRTGKYRYLVHTQQVTR